MPTNLTLPLTVLVLGLAGPAGLAQSPTASVANGHQIFEKATFGGNGRTCVTCHTEETGTLSPAQVAGLGPDSPLFQHDAADVVGGHTFDRVRARATFLVEIPLPANVSIVGSPARSVVVPRGVPTTANGPALDPVLMWDGREPSLQAQAASAYLRHSQVTQPPTPGQLDQLADYEKSLFNRTELKRFARAGVAPSLPEGRTPAERRGRVWLTDDNPLNGNPARGRCVHCHSGPLLNQFSAGAVALGFPAPLGARFFSAFVSEFNLGGQPVQTYAFVQTTQGATVTNYVTSPDLGRALVTGKVQDANAFKIPTLWGAKDTAPYFHNNSAASLGELMEHYQVYFRVVFGGPAELGFTPGPDYAPDAMTDADKADILAYLQRL